MVGEFDRSASAVVGCSLTCEHPVSMRDRVESSVPRVTGKEPQRSERARALAAAYARPGHRHQRRSTRPKATPRPYAPATNGFSESSRKPTISWAFVLFQRIATGLSTGLSGLFIGTYSALAYAAYAGWRDASGPHAAPLRRRVGTVRRCIGQPYACPMQLHYSTSWRRSRVGRKDKPC